MDSDGIVKQVQGTSTTMTSMHDYLIDSYTNFVNTTWAVVVLMQSARGGKLTSF